MEEIPKQCEISPEDLRLALQEMNGYIDVTEDDLKKIYALAVRHARERGARRVVVRDIMTRDVITIGPDADLTTVATLLSEHGISGLPVVDGDGRVIGVVSEADALAMAGMQKRHAFKDVIRRILGEPLPGRGESNIVRDAMSSPAITTMPEADIGEAAQLLDEKRIKRLPVVDERGTLIGVISRADIVRAMKSP